MTAQPPVSNPEVGGIDVHAKLEPCKGEPGSMRGRSFEEERFGRDWSRHSVTERCVTLNEDGLNASEPRGSAVTSCK